jgi:hypothetical protein
MVHQLPASVTIRQALNQYLLESKGIAVDIGKTIDASSSNTMDETNETILIPESNGKDCSSETKKDAAAAAAANEEEQDDPPLKDDDGSSEVAVLLLDDDETTLQQRHQEWRDMANGICLFFDQALAFRLLYPSEQAQLAVLETMEEFKETPKSELYGCEHLLRLFCQWPLLLEDAYSSTKKTKDDDDEDYQEQKSTILAKLNDLARFLQKNQSTLFQQSYRKKNEAELKQEQRLVKRLERQKQRKLQQQQQQPQETPSITTEVVASSI